MNIGRKKTKIIYRCLKRILDIVCSIVATAIIIRVQDGGAVFFKQTRIGKNGKPFKLVKFRSMAIDNNMYNFEEEDKITKFGEFIRKTSIDEIPQFWNVLRGDMSFIGPRPWVKEYYDNMTDEQRVRYTVRPGITGLAQVSGRNNIDIFKKIKYDVEYVKKLSLYMDIVVFFRTIKAVFSKKGVYHKKISINEELKMLEQAKKAANEKNK